MNRFQTLETERARLHGQPLTDSEKQVLQLVVWGYSISEIAAELDMPERRAKYRCDCIRYKAGVGSKRGLIRWARDQEAA